MGGREARAQPGDPRKTQIANGANRPESHRPATGSPLSVTQDQLIDEFLEGCFAGLDRFDDQLRALAVDQEAGAPLAEILRILHNIKGTCGFFRFSRLEALAHAGESLLDQFCARQVRLTPSHLQTLGQLVDALRELSARIERDRAEGDGEEHALLTTLERLAREPGDVADLGAAPAGEGGGATLFGELLVQRGLVAPEAIAGALAQQVGGDPRQVGEILVDAGLLQPSDVQEALKAQVESGASDPWHRMLRIDRAQLEGLARQIEALARLEDRVQALARAVPLPEPLLEAHGELSRISSELQAHLRRLRFLPVGTLWARFPGLARHLASSLGKQVRLEMVGEEIELDRSVLEALRDPFTHLLRNAIDHGIEPPALRRSRGKPSEGRLRLRAAVEPGAVLLEISDDGAGIDPRQLRRAAIDQGLLDAGAAADLGSHELLRLIFHTRFTTAKQVTRLSGRGLGLDVVRRNIEAVGGEIEVESRLGRGTLFRLRIPQLADASDRVDP